MVHQPNATSKTMLGVLVDKSRRRVVPFDIGFVRRPDDDASLAAPPLATMLRGGRGGEVRLKLFLSMQLIAVAHPYDVTRTASYWAHLLSLPDPGLNGARRVNDAIRWLEEHKLIRTERHPARPPQVFLLSQLGTGVPYSRPGAPRYINLPVAFWQNGWIVTLSASAIAMWLITQEIQGGKTSSEEVWVPPGLAKERYDLSDDTRTKGTRELEEHLLLTIGRTRQGNEWTWDRLRNTYWLNLARLNDEPGSPPNPTSQPTPTRRRRPRR